MDDFVEITVPAGVAIPLRRATEKKMPIKPETAAKVTGGLLGAAILAALVFNDLTALAQAGAVRLLQNTHATSFATVTKGPTLSSTLPYV